MCDCVCGTVLYTISAKVREKERLMSKLSPNANFCYILIDDWEWERNGKLKIKWWMG